MLDGVFGGVVAGCFFVGEGVGGGAEDQWGGRTIVDGGNGAGAGEGEAQGVYGVD